MGAPGQIIAQRYALRRFLGQGAFGEVWEAEDRILGESVALKLLRQGYAEPAAVRREIATLRMLRLPGVVRMLDEGMEGSFPFLVMHLVRGARFPGKHIHTPCAWKDLAPLAMGILETLAHVHAAGVVHRDLKPENILVNDEGQAVLVDFGLSFRPFYVDEAEGEKLVGTPLYAAPEQIRGEPIVPQTDLYALGVVLYEALAGKPPHDAEDLGHLIAMRLSGPPTPLHHVVPGMPHDVAMLIDSLLAIEVEDRPRSAIHVIHILRGQSTGSALGSSLFDGAAEGPPREVDALRALFAGPERLFHLQSDAAQMLMARTQGFPQRIEQVLAAWERDGIARRSGERFVVDRDGLDRLAIEQEMPATNALAPPDEIAGAIESAARRLAAQGRLGQAIALLAFGVQSLHERCKHEKHALLLHCLRLLERWVEIALFDRTPRALDQVLYELCRFDPEATDLLPLASMVRAALALWSGSERAHTLAEEVRPFRDARLERARLDLRIAAARRMSQINVDAVLQEAKQWADDTNTDEARAALYGWRARLCYQEGRFEEAAELQMQAAAHEAWMMARVVALFHAAGSWLEAFRLEDAAQCAEQAKTLATACRSAHYEAKAEWLLRTIAYRAKEAIAPDLEWVDAVAELGVPDLEALVCFTEASVLFRMGEPAESARLAERARRLWTGMSKRAGAALARCLAMACGTGIWVEEARSMAAAAIQCAVPGMGIQMLGLLSKAFPQERGSWAHHAETLAQEVPTHFWAMRMDVLSVNEALHAIRV